MASKTFFVSVNFDLFLSFSSGSGDSFSNAKLISLCHFNDINKILKYNVNKCYDLRCVLLSGNLIQQKRQDFDQSRNIKVNNVDISDECQSSYHEFGL